MKRIQHMRGERVLFPLGRVLATPGALALMSAHSIDPATLLHRHQSGDWGTLSDDDHAANDAAVRDGERLLSSYVVAPHVKLWIITEWDRSVTTILLPSEY